MASPTPDEAQNRVSTEITTVPKDLLICVFIHGWAFETVVEQVKEVLTFNGTFIFSIEHPIYTAHHSQDWIYDATGKPAHWPVDDYRYEGERQVEFLETRVIKYHRTLSHYLNVLIDHHFVIDGLAEPVPSEKMLEENPHMKEELRRPMMLIISARRK